MRYSTDMSIDDTARQLIEDALYKVEGFYLYGGDMSEGLAEELLNVNDSLPNFMSDLEDGMSFIARNADYFSGVWYELNEKGITINPLMDIEDCIEKGLIYTMKDYLLDTCLISEHEHDEGFSIELTKEVLDEMAEEMGMTIEAEYDR